MPLSFWIRADMISKLVPFFIHRSLGNRDGLPLVLRHLSSHATMYEERVQRQRRNLLRSRDVVAMFPLQLIGDATCVTIPFRNTIRRGLSFARQYRCRG